jgi:hypothetical protein
MPNKNIQLTKYLWDFMDDDFYLYEYMQSCRESGYSSFDKWEDGQFVEDNDLFFSLCDILSHFDEDDSDNQP